MLRTIITGIDLIQNAIIFHWRIFYRERKHSSERFQVLNYENFAKIQTLIFERFKIKTTRLFFFFFWFILTVALHGMISSLYSRFVVIFLHGRSLHLDPEVVGRAHETAAECTAAPDLRPECSSRLSRLYKYGWGWLWQVARTQKIVADSRELQCKSPAQRSIFGGAALQEHTKRINRGTRNGCIHLRSQPSLAQLAYSWMINFPFCHFDSADVSAVFLPVRALSDRTADAILLRNRRNVWWVIVHVIMFRL